MALKNLKTAQGSEWGDRLEHVACQVADMALEMTWHALGEASMYLRPQIGVPRSGPSVVPALQIPLPGTTRLWENDQGGQRG